MKLSRTFAVTVLAVSSTLALPIRADVPAAPAKDWPQFHGPARDNLSREKGLLQEVAQGRPAPCLEDQGHRQRVFVGRDRGRHDLHRG